MYCTLVDIDGAGARVVLVALWLLVVLALSDVAFVAANNDDDDDDDDDEVEDGSDDDNGLNSFVFRFATIRFFFFEDNPFFRKVEKRLECWQCFCK